jgi:hypothetical protein
MATMTMVAQTPACFSACEIGYSGEFGPAFNFDVLRQGEKVGQPIILFRASNTDPAEDFVINRPEWSVSTFYAAGLVSRALALHYGGLGCEYYDTSTATCAYHYPDDQAFELEYVPYAVDSGLCVGVGTTAVDGTPVGLEPCGESAKTVWVEDYADNDFYDGNATPLINGSDTDFSDPYVLHYPGNGYPTDMPRPQLNTHTMQHYSDSNIDDDNIVYDNELWFFS